MKDYNKFTIKTTPFIPEQITDLLWSLEIAGINETDDAIQVYADPLGFETKTSFEEFLNSLVEQGLISSYEIEEEFVEDRNWNEEYEKKVRVVEVTDKIVIKPTFKEYEPKPGQLIIHIDPKMSFGTGEHETTRLVLAALDRYIKGGESILDVGSGTGVLAIAAVLLGGEKAIGVDNDEWCLINGEENVELNKLQDKVSIKLGELKDISETNFDLIVANINKHILLEIGNDIKNKIRKEGTLILSGLLDVDEKDINKYYTDLGFKYIETTPMNEWVSMVFKAE